MIQHPYLDELRQQIRQKNDKITPKRTRWIKANKYYYKQLLRSLRFVIDEDARVLHVRCGIGYILNELKPAYGVGVNASSEQIKEAKKNHPHLNFVNHDPEDIQLDEKFDYILVTSVEDIVDIKAVLDSVKHCCGAHTRVIVTNYNYLWNPLVKLAEFLRMRIPQRVHNWVAKDDLNNLLHLSNYELVTQKKIVLFPYNIPLVSYILNRFVARLPFFRSLAFLRITVSRQLLPVEKEPSVSIIIPCKNEAGNVEDAVKRIPELGSHTEIIFCDDKSTDGTADKVKEMMEKYPDKDIRLEYGPGISKSANVWTGFDAAKGDILMILDADLTVLPEELPYFYEAISRNRGEFINGSRLVYPMHKDAMRLANVIGNKFFSMAFSYILDTPIKDTLCGTKVLWREDYEKMKRLKGSWGVRDRWGDYELIFGAAKRHLKIIDMPVHYYERTYGETKMTGRFKNGWIMLRMCWAALFRIKFY